MERNFRCKYKQHLHINPCSSRGSCTVKDNCSSIWVLPAPEMPQIS
ncbi:hypothetical protein DOY81_008636, partial [Sarcophaga bullata]